MAEASFPLRWDRSTVCLERVPFARVITGGRIVLLKQNGPRWTRAVLKVIDERLPLERLFENQLPRQQATLKLTHRLTVHGGFVPCIHGS